MRTVFSPDHRFQDARAELMDGRLRAPVEKPARAARIHDAVRTAGLGPIVAPEPVSRSALTRVHTDAYLDFLEAAWPAWARQHGEWDALPLCWPARTLVAREPDAIEGRLGYYSFDAGTPITAGTWRAATATARPASSACAGRPATTPRASCSAAIAS
jgi:acetoin utilization deacetylase AcuC-like enzyme